jgi:Tfp pilus assembly protein PilF
LLSGVLLLALGALGMWISKSSYNSGAVQAFCRAWYCPDEFSVERIFQLSQKAALGDPAGQLRDFQRALAADSASAYRWADVGDSEFNLHDLTRAQYAYRQALANGPRSLVILQRAANFFFEAGLPVEATMQLRKILSDPALSDSYDTVFLTYSRLGLPLSQILSEGIPPQTKAGARFLRFWINRGKEPEARETWDWLRREGNVDDSDAGSYVNFLLGQHEPAIAQAAWQSYTQGEMPTYCKTNWVFNGGFEAPFRKPSELDWTIVPRPEVNVERVKTERVDGSWALQLRFHALQNVGYRETYQMVVLTPGTWHFSARIKTQSITTDQGPHFHLASIEGKKVDVWTEPEKGSADWHRVEASFLVGPATQAIRMEVLRSPSMQFDNKISGTMWIDDVTLSH